MYCGDLEANTITTITIGPMLDKDDADTEKTGLSITAASVFASKNGGAKAQVNDGSGCSEDAHGIYRKQINATDTNTEGLLTIYVHFADCLYIRQDYTVLSQAAYASKYTEKDTGLMSVDSVAISGDTTSADNLELQYDTTGLAGDTFPATQSQLSKITNVGAAVHTPASSYTLTTGVQSANTVADTEELNQTRHTHTDADNEMDLYYEFIVGSGIPEEVTVTGYLTGKNDNLEVLGYDWVSETWKQIGTLEGKAQSTDEVNAYAMFVNMVGSGTDEGKVRVRFTDGAFTLSTATLAIDQIFVSFSVGVEGYAGGAIFIDTTITNTNTVVGIDGTARNPVSTIAAANTLSASTNLNKFEVAPGSSITFAASQENQVFRGDNWTLALGGRSISGSHIIGANVTGICTGASHPRFEHCHFGAVTLPPSDNEGCVLEGTVTAGSAGDFFFERCQSGVAGILTPIFDFGSGLGASDVNFRDYSGGIEIKNMGRNAGNYNMSLEGNGQLIIASDCSATSTIAIRGNFTITDNAAGAVTLSNEAMFDHNAIIDSILEDTETTIPAAESITDAKIDTLQDDMDDVVAGDKPVIDGTVTFEQVLKAMLAFVGGIAAGGGGNEIIFKNQAGDKDVITLSGLDANGNRTTTTLDFT